MLGAYSVPPLLLFNQALAIGVTSYNGMLYFGIMPTATRGDVVCCRGLLGQALDGAELRGSC